ncbi:MAG: hypothetical protein ACOYVK_17875 [Bacillota bacterium]
MSKKFMNVERNIHEIKLRQMGAEVQVIRGIMHYVRFNLDGTIVEYVYHINNKDNYFLQRRSPYPLNVGIYESHDDVINIIQHDIAQMLNAKKSKKFDKFIEINRTLCNIERNFEDLYLYYNIPGVQAGKIEEKIAELKTLILETQKISERVYFDKDPDSI